MENLEDYLIKKDADLVALTEDVRNFLKKRFTKQTFAEELENPGCCSKDHISKSNPAYVPLLKNFQEVRKLGYQYMLGDDVEIAFTDGLRYILFRLGNSGIIVDGSGNVGLDTRYCWTPKQKAVLFDVLEKYIEKKGQEKG